MEGFSDWVKVGRVPRPVFNPGAGVGFVWETSLDDPNTDKPDAARIDFRKSPLPNFLIATSSVMYVKL
jgi:hypothetical protein